MYYIIDAEVIRASCDRVIRGSLCTLLIILGILTVICIIDIWNNGRKNK